MDTEWISERKLKSKIHNTRGTGDGKEECHLHCQAEESRSPKYLNPSIGVDSFGLICSGLFVSEIPAATENAKELGGISVVLLIALKNYISIIRQQGDFQKIIHRTKWLSLKRLSAKVSRRSWVTPTHIKPSLDNNDQKPERGSQLFVKWIGFCIFYVYSIHCSVIYKGVSAVLNSILLC